MPRVIDRRRFLYASGLVLFLEATLFSLPAAADGTLPYLFQRLENATYRASFDALFRGQKNLEPWLRRYLKSGDGVDVPGQLRNAGGRQYELYSIYQPHHAVGNGIYVVFQPGGSAAWAVFTKESTNYRFFGTPPGPVEEILTAAANE